MNQDNEKEHCESDNDQEKKKLAIEVLSMFQTIVNVIDILLGNRKEK